MYRSRVFFNLTFYGWVKTVSTIMCVHGMRALYEKDTKNV